MSLDVYLQKTMPTTVYHANVTHNLGKMAEDVGLYYHLWRPEEIGIKKARALIEPLSVGLKRLKDDPERFKAFNPSNGWGSYEALVNFIESYLAACMEDPDAEIIISR